MSENTPFPHNQSSKVLIVEDTEDLRNAISAALQGSGIDTLSVADGEEGYVFAQRMRPAIMIVDIMMPRVDGISMIRKIRKETWGQDIDFVILTNMSNDDLTKQAKELGVEDYFIKSEWPLSKLVEMIKEKLLAHGERGPEVED